MHLALLIVSVILFLVDFLIGITPTQPAWARGFVPLGLAFFAAAFAVPG